MRELPKKDVDYFESSSVFRQEDGNAPRVDHYQYGYWPKLGEGAIEMQFRLVYNGPLRPQPADTSRPKERQLSIHKHDIRRILHRQLRELWGKDQFLRARMTVPRPGPEPQRPDVAHLADRYTMCGHRFVPLVTEAEGLGCALDVVFLRRDQPGDLIKSGGDIDNRIKTFFDSLRMPRYIEEVNLTTFTDDEDPMFCLLENDSLITEVRIITDRLLIPPAGADETHNVFLLVRARIQVVDSSRAPIFFMT